MKSKDLAEVIRSTKGRFFSVTFVKKNGEVRKLVGRLGVTKHLVGGRSNLDPSKFIVAFDVQAGGYRAINVDTILSVRCFGQEWLVDETQQLAA